MIDFVDQHVAWCTAVVDVRDTTRLCDQNGGILMGSHGSRLHVPQDICAVTGDSLISSVFFWEDNLLLPGLPVVICEINIVCFAQRRISEEVDFFTHM